MPAGEALLTGARTDEHGAGSRVAFREWRKHRIADGE